LNGNKINKEENESIKDENGANGARHS